MIHPQIGPRPVSDLLVTRNARVELEPSDAELVSAASVGDLQAFGLLVSRWQPLVVVLTRRAQVEQLVLGSTDDLAVQVWSAVWRGLPRFRFDVELPTWLSRVVSATVVAARRAQTRALAAPGADGTGRANDRELEDAVDGLLVRSALEALDDAERCVFLNRVVHGLSWVDNAAAAGTSLGRHVSLGAARSLYESALASLQRQLGDQ